uniref:LHFPL tetraspan subfamily member 7 n=1 Tax=Sphenodon punctatus TaxID=8508 RepID=A0A8D0GVJ1_SPHPU
MVSCVGSVWVILSLALACISGFSLTSSAWFRNGTLSLGVFTHCYWPVGHTCNQTCVIYWTLEDIPSVSGKVAAVLLFAGWLLLVFGAVLTLSWTLIPQGLCQRRVCTPARYLQTAAVMVSISGLLVFPCSLDSALAKEACGASSIYNAGKCKLGWGFMVAILDVMLSCFLPIIGRYNLNKIKTNIIFPTATESIVLVTADEQ